MTRRRGVSLLEVIAVMVSSTLILGLSAGLIHLVQRADRAGRDHLTDRETAARLARTFRADVHAALAAGPDDGPAEDRSRLLLELPAGLEVEYRIRGDELIRTRRGAGEERSRDAFRLPRRTTARIEVGGRGGRQSVVSLVYGDGGAAAKEHRIDGLLGRDHRFEDRGE